jgi:hypothetical protein
MKIETCSYCGSPIELKDSSIIYNGKSYGMVYICTRYPDCEAYVGTHKDTDVPLGTLADNELRSWRKKAHSVFDSLWRSGRITRKAAYTKLQIAMGMKKKEAHIAKMNIEQCKDVIKYFSNIVVDK